MTRSAMSWFAAACLALGACSGDESPGGAGGAGGSLGSGGAMGGLDVRERDSLERAGRHETSTQKASVLADSFFDFDPTIVPTASAEMNAQAVRDQVTTNLKGCGSVMLTGTSVTVSFGPPPGCTLMTGTTISGMAAVAVSKSGNTISLALTATKLVVDGKDVDGSLTFSTSNGSTFAVNGKYTSGGETVTITALTIVGSANSFTLDGSVMVAEAAGPMSTLSFRGVVSQKGKCYPSAGSMTVMKGDLNMTITFSAATADTGKVTVTQGRRTYPSTLPPYGTCPTSSGSGLGSADGGARG